FLVAFEIAGARQDRSAQRRRDGARGVARVLHAEGEVGRRLRRAAGDAQLDIEAGRVRRGRGRRKARSRCMGAAPPRRPPPTAPAPAAARKTVTPSAGTSKPTPRSSARAVKAWSVNFWKPKGASRTSIAPRC